MRTHSCCCMALTPILSHSFILLTLALSLFLFVSLAFTFTLSLPQLRLRKKETRLKERDDQDFSSPKLHTSNKQRYNRGKRTNHSLRTRIVSVFLDNHLLSFFSFLCVF